MISLTNLNAMRSAAAMAESNADIKTSMERLSTGSKINSASDDAAGLAISTRMDTQILGLAKAGLTPADIDLWEINEAFASVVLRYIQDLDLDPEVTNVNGGAIAMGHPLGATGGCLVSTVLDELERRDAKRAMLSLCVGGGMGISTIIERV